MHRPRPHESQAWPIIFTNVDSVSARRKLRWKLEIHPREKNSEKSARTVTFRSPPSNKPMLPRDDGGPLLTARSILHEEAEIDPEGEKTVYPMRSESNLEVLMVRYQQGDFAAATAIVEAFSPQLYRFFAAQSHSRADADDLLQETWLRIHKVRHTYRTGEPALPWFYAIARYVRVDHYRKTIRSTAGARQLEERAVASASLAGRPDTANDLEALLAPLSESQREVIEMLKVTGMSLEEVARATSSSVGSVKQKVHRAYKKLRQTMSAAGLRKEPGDPLS